MYSNNTTLGWDLSEGVLCAGPLYRGALADTPPCTPLLRYLCPRAVCTSRGRVLTTLPWIVTLTLALAAWRSPCHERPRPDECRCKPQIASTHEASPHQSFCQPPVWVTSGCEGHVSRPTPSRCEQGHAPTKFLLLQAGCRLTSPPGCGKLTPIPASILRRTRHEVTECERRLLPIDELVYHADPHRQALWQLGVDELGDLRAQMRALRAGAKSESAVSNWRPSESPWRRGHQKPGARPDVCFAPRARRGSLIAAKLGWGDKACEVSWKLARSVGTTSSKD